jgi:hypothetical protein
MSTFPSIEQSESPRRPVRRPSFRRGASPRSLADDRRGVTELLGLILAFTLVVSLVVLMQVSAVPTWNKAVEYEHSQRVQQDFDDFGAATTRVAATGVGETVALERGVDYPSRFVFINPPPASGTLSASGSGSVSFSNLAFAEDNAQDYWTNAPVGDRPDLTAKALVYDPGYHEYRDAGTVVYEAGVQYRSFATASIADRVTLVDGNRISLVLLDADLATSGVDPATLDLMPVSAPARPVTVSNVSGGDVSIEIPSGLPAAEWEAWLEADGELVADGGHVRGVTQVVANETVRLDLEPGAYELRIVKLGLGGGTVEQSARYLVPVSATSVNANVGESVAVAVEVRDAYNNPVSGVPVDFDDPSLPTVVTDEAGRATTEFVPSGTGSYQITASIDDASQAYESVQFETFVGNGQLAALLSGGGLDLGSMINPTQNVYVYETASYSIDNSENEVYVDVTFNRTYSTELEISRTRVNFVTNNGPGGSDGAAPLDVSLGHSTVPTPYEFEVGDGYHPTHIDPGSSTETVLEFTFSGFESDGKGGPGKSKMWDPGTYAIVSIEFHNPSTGAYSYGTYFVVPGES